MGTTPTLPPSLEAHLKELIGTFTVLVSNKYRRGAIEHGGDIRNYRSLELVDMALDECIDQFTYLATLRQKLIQDSKTPSVREYIEGQAAESKKSGFITDLFGRKRKFTGQ